MKKTLIMNPPVEYKFFNNRHPNSDHSMLNTLGVLIALTLFDIIVYVWSQYDGAIIYLIMIKAAMGHPAHCYLSSVKLCLNLGTI